MQSEWNGIAPRDDQLVVALVVGKGGRSKGPGREQLGVGVGDPARRLLESLGVHIGAERAQKVARRALHRVVVDRGGPLRRGHRLGQRKRGDARIFQGHGGFAPPSQPVLTDGLSIASGKSASPD